LIKLFSKKFDGHASVVRLLINLHGKPVVYHARNKCLLGLQKVGRQGNGYSLQPNFITRPIFILQNAP
jgi:hypothetical protein